MEGESAHCEGNEKKRMGFTGRPLLDRRPEMGQGGGRRKRESAISLGMHKKEFQAL